MGESWPLGYKYYSPSKDNAIARAIALGLTAADVTEISLLKRYVITDKETTVKHLLKKDEIVIDTTAEAAELVYSDEVEDEGEVYDEQQALFKVEVKPA